MNSFGLEAAGYSRIARGLAVLMLVMLAGTAGYMIIKDWSLLDAAYMTSITVTTVGYSEVRPLSQTGQVFTIGLMFLGVGAAFYILTALVAAIIEGDLRQVASARRMKLTIERINNHHVVCGFGRVGERVARELQSRRAPFVVVDANQSRVEEARASGLQRFLRRH